MHQHNVRPEPQTVFTSTTDWNLLRCCDDIRLFSTQYLITEFPHQGSAWFLLVLPVSVRTFL
jgi:hypothetical protein